MKPEGALVALATPFTADGSVNRETLRLMVDFLIERGVDGIFAASTVGEFAHLSPPQRHELIALAVEFSDGRVPVLGGATDVSAARVIEHCREIRRSGASYAVIAPPFYYPLSQEEILAFYRVIADAIEIPFVLYHIPQCSNRMTIETMLRIVHDCGPAALKNSNTDVLEMLALLERLAPLDVPYLIGPDELLLTGLVHGAAGSMSGLTGVIPEAVRRLIDSFRSGDLNCARRIQFALLELLNLTSDLSFPSGLKVMYAARGFEMGPPLQAQSPGAIQKMEEREPVLAQKIASIIEML
jgi:dihydrodipicolinate synthase/N-acetylneuraminate lyase